LITQFVEFSGQTWRPDEVVKVKFRRRTGYWSDCSTRRRAVEAFNVALVAASRTAPTSDTNG
jgi:hypothetical protein